MPRERRRHGQHVGREEHLHATLRGPLEERAERAADRRVPRAERLIAVAIHRGPIRRLHPIEVDQLEQHRHRNRVVAVRDHALDVRAPVLLDALERRRIDVRRLFEEHLVEDSRVVRVVAAPAAGQRNADAAAVDETERKWRVCRRSCRKWKRTFVRARRASGPRRDRDAIDGLEGQGSREGRRESGSTDEQRDADDAWTAHADPEAERYIADI